jgi:hypothetical protein
VLPWETGLLVTTSRSPGEGRLWGTGEAMGQQSHLSSLLHWPLLSQQDLFRVLKAYTLYRPEEGYCQAQAPIAAVLLMHMPAEVPPALGRGGMGCRDRPQPQGLTSLSPIASLLVSGTDLREVPAWLLQ